MATIKRFDVKSSNIRSIGYDHDTQTLEVEFNKGDVYQYSDVPPEVWVQFKGADSIGKYFHSHIRNGGYTFTKI